VIRRLFAPWADLWAGRLPLKDAFWTYAVFWSLLVNISTTLLTLGLVAARAPNWTALATHVIPIPWNLLVLVGVWRSAGHPSVPGPIAWIVRALACAWLLALSAT